MFGNYFINTPNATLEVLFLRPYLPSLITELRDVNFFDTPCFSTENKMNK